MILSMGDAVDQAASGWTVGMVVGKGGSVDYFMHCVMVDPADKPTGFDPEFNAFVYEGGGVLRVWDHHSCKEFCDGAAYDAVYLIGPVDRAVVDPVVSAALSERNGILVVEAFH